MQGEILSLLREKKTYVSGQQLCEQFGVSRTAVWKAIEQLRKEGYQIRAVQNKGYILVEDKQEEHFNGAELASRMDTRWAAKKLFFYDTIDSTNTEAKRLGEEGAPDGTLVVADMQTAGKGRRGRGWISPAHTNVYFTLLLRPRFAPDKAAMLTLVIAHSMCRAVEEVTGLEAGIKWPNDIVVSGKKICGILTEMSVELNEIKYVVIGVGINVREQEFPEELREKAIALDTACGTRVDRTRLITAIMKAFEEDYEKFLQTVSLEGLQSSYEKRMVNCGKEVCVLDPKGEYRGIARGINETGELLVELPDGTIREVYAGEVSVRGIYGYV